MSVSLLNRLLDVVDKLPEKKAIIEGDESTTYRELGRSINKLSAYLSLQLNEGDRVAVLLDNSAEYVVSCYAIWKAGGCVVGLNTALKAADLNSLIRHSGARFLIAGARHRELTPIVAELVELELLITVGENSALDTAILWSDIIESQLSAQKEVEQNSDSLAAIIYTSGTTGHPKGVTLSHENLSANVESIQQYLGISSSDKIMCVLPFYYSYGNSILHTHLSCGASLVIENSFMYPHKVMERMVKEEITAFAGVPSTYYLLLARTKLANYDFSSLRYCTQAGGAMDVNRIQAFLELVPNVEFLVMYGQTEASARLSYLPPERMKEKPGSVGIPIPGVELTIRDANNDVLPSGKQGEVCARGANIMRGYWRDEEETDKVMKGGWLHTGDLGYVDKDGYYYLVGRNKEMIKTGAHRISPQEIEELICQVPGVLEVAVVGVNDEVLGQVLKACVVAEGGEDTLKKSIQLLCKKNLPVYKIPKEVVFYQSFPKTGSGKTKKYLL